MNAERLLTHYERIADAPDAIARLRRFILGLAVRGKLVPQDASDEPASDLLKRIAKEKARLVKAGEIRKPKQSVPIREAELPIDLPRNWAWARLCEIGNLSGGMTPSMNRSDFWDGDIVWLSPKDIKSDEVADSELKISALGLAETRLELYRQGCLFIVARSGILKRTFPVSINRVPATANQDMKVLAPFLDGQERYLQIMFRGLSDFLLRELVKTGTTVQSLKYAEFEQQPFPLPPLDEQHRIVAKVGELMGLCDRLEAARSAREAARDRLVAASLDRLNAPDPETFQADARFALAALPALITRHDQIKTLRQTILNLAMRGKLVPQYPNDEPASELLTRNAKEKARLVKAGEIRKPKALSAVGPQDVPVGEIIPGWTWTRLGNVSTVITKGSTPTSYGHAYTEEGVNFIKVESIRNGLLLGKNVSSFISQETHQFLARSRLEEGDILFSIAGSIGTCAVVTELVLPANTNQALAIIRGTHTVFVSAFLLKALQSSVAGPVLEKARGGAMSNVSLDDIQNFVVPLPPLAEQHRIVAKVDELMGLCDRLEASLTASDTTRQRLLTVLLHNALNNTAMAEAA